MTSQKPTQAFASATRFCSAILALLYHLISVQGDLCEHYSLAWCSLNKVCVINIHLIQKANNNSLSGFRYKQWNVNPKHAPLSILIFPNTSTDIATGTTWSQ